MPFIVPIIEGVIAIGAAVSSFVAAAGVIGQGLIMAGIGIAASYLINVLTPKPPASIGGVNFQRDYGTSVSRQVACGRIAMAGHDIYVNTFNPSNRTLQQIYVISDYPVTALTGIWAGGIQIFLAADTGDYRGRVVTGGPGGSGITFGTTDVNGHSQPGLVWIKFVDGRQTVSDSGLGTFANPAGRWNNTDIGVGVAHIIVTLEYDKDNNSSFPDLFFEFTGAPLYDWRKDSTAGGSGSHRWGNIATYEYSANPIVIEYNYRRGFSINGDLFCGMGMPASDLPLDKFTMAANLCDETQPDSFPRYQCSIILDCMKTHSDNLQSIALSCGAMQIDTLEGSWPLVGSDQTIVAIFTDDDIISTAANFKRTEKQSMSTLVNSVSGNYPEPLQLWSMIGYDPQFATTFIPIDRRTRDLNMDFPQVPSLRQADQLAWIYLYENRFETTATVTLRPRYQVLEAGDWVNWNSARYNGTKTFIVTGKQLLNLDSGDGPRNVVISLQERNGQIYEGITPVPAVLPFGPGVPIYLAELADFIALPVTVVGSAGMAAPGIRVSWDAITDVTVSGIDLEYYPTGDTTSIIHKIIGVDATVAILAEGVVSNTAYAVRAKILTNPLRVTTFNAGVTVTTPNVGVSVEQLNAEIQYQLTTLQDLFADKLAAFDALVASFGSNQDARNWMDKKQIRSQFSSLTGVAFAQISTLQTVATDAATAFASYQIAVTAQFDTTNASVTSNTTAIATLNGYAAAEYSVTLDVNGYASGFQLFNGGGGVSTTTFIQDKFQIAFPGHAGGAAIPVFTVGNVGGSPKVGIRSDMYIDGSITATSISVINLSAINANLGAVTAGTLTDPTGTKMLIDLNNSRIVISV